MNKNTKIILGISAGIVLLCCVALAGVYFYLQRVGAQAISMSPEEKARVGHEIADYTLPEGYEEVMAMSVAGIKMVIIGPSSSFTTGETALTLMQMPTAGYSQEEMERQMRQAWERQGGSPSQGYTSVGTREATVRGQKITLTISEAGSQGQDKIMRQEIGIFTGKNEKMVMFMAMGEKGSFNEDIVDEFLGSIK